jgi:diapolycopene oxygenase
MCNFAPCHPSVVIVKAVIIGSGIAGIACSIRLAALQGWQVAVYEANSTPGGKLATFTQDGFRFDQGGMLFSMPSLVDELFVLAGKHPRQYFQYNSLPIACRYFYDDKTVLNAYTNPKQFGEEVCKKLNVEAGVVESYLARSADLFERTKKVFLEQSLQRWSTYFSRDSLSLLAHSFQMPLIGSFHRTNRLQLEHPKLTQLFDRFATYLGSSPYKASGMLQAIPHLEHNIGTFFPEGGMYTIVQSLVKLSQELGVQYHFNAFVEEILLGRQRVKGIRTGTETIQADIVVSNMDVAAMYRLLLPHSKAPAGTMKQERSSSAIVFYWGVEGTFEELALHNIFFSKDYPKEFEAIFKEKQVSDDPTVYVGISAKEQPDDAPEGHENWLVMLNVPANQGQDWDKVVARARTQILDKLRRALGKDVGPLIRSERIWDPRSIEAGTFAYQGALYGASANTKLAAFSRHPNFSKSVKGLYFCGGSVHPGGGIPRCLLSAKIVADLVAQRDLGRSL